MKLEPLSIERQSLITCLQELSLAKLKVNGFFNEELDDMINFISSSYIEYSCNYLSHLFPMYMYYSNM